MDNKNIANNYKSYYLIPALVAGVLTAWIVTGSVGFMILGAVLGLLSAGLWLNVAENREEV